MALAVVSLSQIPGISVSADTSSQTTLAFNTFNLTKLILCRTLIMKRVGTYFDNKKGRDV